MGLAESSNACLTAATFTSEPSESRCALSSSATAPATTGDATLPKGRNGVWQEREHGSMERAMRETSPKGVQQARKNGESIETTARDENETERDAHRHEFIYTEIELSLIHI